MIDTIRLIKDMDWDAPIRGFYQIIQAGNGEFIRARREGLHAVIQISDTPHEGCFPMVEILQVQNRISALTLELLYGDFIHYLPYERLVWVNNEGGLHFPAQVASAGMVRPENPYDSMIDKTLFDIHSHNTMNAYFSSQDDKDESRGFRVFIVIGRVGSDRPQIAARVGIFGHFMPCPIETVAHVPAGLKFEDIHALA